MPAAIAIPSLISAGTSIVGGLLGSSASKSAAGTQAQAAQAVADKTGVATANAQNRMGEAVGQANTRLDDAYNSQVAALQPYQAAGGVGIQTQEGLIPQYQDLSKQSFSFDPSQITNDAGYQFMMQQGQKALERSANARSGALGGGTSEALTKYAQGMASTEFNNAYNRAQSTFNLNHQNTMQALAAIGGIGQNLTGTGQAATNSFNQATQNWGAGTAGNTMQGAQVEGQWGLQGQQQINDALLGKANAQAAGTVGQANSWATALSGVGKAATGYGLMSSMNPAATGATGATKVFNPLTSSAYLSKANLGNALPPNLSSVATPQFADWSSIGLNGINSGGLG